MESVRNGLAAGAAAFAVAATFAFAGPASGADFYAGKNIDFTIGSNPGGGYDTYARTIARTLPNYIPGKPGIIAKNLPGAGSGKAAAYLYMVAPKDGRAIGALFPGAIMQPLYKPRLKSKYDPMKFKYLASANSSTRICATFHTSKTKTFEDVFKRKTVVGASASGGSSRDHPAFMNSLLGAKFNIVSGYKGTVDIILAMEQGEVDGLCGYDWSSFKTQRSEWLREGKVNVLVQVGLDPTPELTKMGVPQIWKFVKDDDTRKVIELIVGEQVFGRPYVAPPGVPDDRVKLLRTAFAGTLGDKQFLADAKKARLQVIPTSGERVQALVEKIYKTPDALVKKAKDAITVK